MTFIGLWTSKRYIAAKKAGQHLSFECCNTAAFKTEDPQEPAASCELKVLNEAEDSVESEVHVAREDPPSTSTSNLPDIDFDVRDNENDDVEDLMPFQPLPQTLESNEFEFDDRDVFEVIEEPITFVVR